MNAEKNITESQNFRCESNIFKNKWGNGKDSEILNDLLKVMSLAHNKQEAWYPNPSLLF